VLRRHRAPVRRAGVRRALLFLCAWAGAALGAPTVALHYGAQPPLDELKAFDIVVVEPDHGFDPLAFRKSYSALYAYVSVGEATPARSYFADIPAAARVARNPDWNAEVIDLSHPAWPEFVAGRIVAPLWAAGYRGFFLDTLDSYRLAPAFDEVAQQQGLVAVVETLHRRFPGIRLILNRGFEVLPKLAGKVEMVAAESLFRGWNALSQAYVEVPEKDREWLLARLREARDTHGLPVLAIDYVPPHDRALARATADRIKALGMVPWVADGALATLGIGQVEVVPRRILMLYDSREAPAVHQTQIVRFAAMPLQHLGYATEFVDVNQTLPDGPLGGRVAGIVLWLNGSPKQPRALTAWLRRQMAAGIRIAAIGQLGPPLDGRVPGELGLAVPGPPAPGKISQVAADPMFGFEARPRPDRQALQHLRVAGEAGRSLLRFADSRGEHYDAAAILPWGGYVLEPFVVALVPGTEQARWVVDPFAFFQAALALPAMPVPDTTTENGRRLMLVHIDGDGFPSLSERPGSPIAGRVLVDDVIARYRVPTTLSVIEGEVAPHGLYPQLSAEMEAVARRAFALPYVEIASHTYSHPFDWIRAARGERPASKEDLYHLDLPGYRVDLEREIVGSIDYIRSRLAPAGKPARILLWSGDAEPDAAALRIAEKAGLLNMNGGNTVITRNFPSLTAVSPLGVLQDGLFQTYAPVMNENVYTNLWTGPFYGFERVIETFEMTERPRRLKPINIYYHSYSASKKASLAALHKVYAWSLAQSPHPVFASAFILKARDFNRMVLARDGDAWVVRGDGELRTLRAPAALGHPDPAASSDLAGFRAGAEGNYLHLAAEEARLRFSAAPPRGPYLLEANARLAAWRPGAAGPAFYLAGHQPIEFALADAAGCGVTADGVPLAPKTAAGGILHFRLNHAAATIQTRCRDR